MHVRGRLAADTFFLVTGIRPDVDRMFAKSTRLLGGEALAAAPDRNVRL